MPAVRRKDPRGRRRPVGYDRAAPLQPIDLEAHKKLLDERKIMSGRSRGHVYWWHNGRLHWRRYVIPRDPRTVTQRRSRAAFGKASRAWSENQPLTQAQRDAWYAEAAKIKSRPRLWLSGFLTAQQYFVGSNSFKDRWGLPLLLEPPMGGRKNAEGSPPSAVLLGRTRRQNRSFSAQVEQPKKLARPSWEPDRACAVPAPSQAGAAKGGTGRPTALRVPIQVRHYQPLTRPSSDCPRPSPVPLPVQCRWHAPSHTWLECLGLAGVGAARPPQSSAWPTFPRKARFRHLWRGG